MTALVAPYAWEALIVGNGRRVYATRGYRVVEGRTLHGTVSWSVEAREDGSWHPIQRRGRALKSGGHTTHARTWRTADGAREFVERRRAGEAA